MQKERGDKDEKRECRGEGRGCGHERGGIMVTEEGMVVEEGGAMEKEGAQGLYAQMKMRMKGVSRLRPQQHCLLRVRLRRRGEEVKECVLLVGPDTIKEEKKCNWVVLMKATTKIQLEMEVGDAAI